MLIFHKRLYLLIVVMMSLCLFLSSTFATATTIAAVGTLYPSGEKILISFELSEEMINKYIVGSGDTYVEGNWNSLKYDVIAKGAIESVSQGINNSVIYWKGSKLWRATKSGQRVICDFRENNLVLDFKNVLIEPHEGKTSNFVAVIGKDYGEITEERFAQKLIRAYDAEDSKSTFGVVGTPTELESKPIGWIDSNRLLSLVYDEDNIRRVITSKLMIFDVVTREEIEKILHREMKPDQFRHRLTSLPDEYLELTAAVGKELIAVLTYNEKTKKFRIGIKNVNDLSKEIMWIPFTDYISEHIDGFKNNITYLEWSSDQRFLAMGLVKNDRLMVWDNKKQEWFKIGDSNTINTNADNILWLDNDKLITFSSGSLQETFIFGQLVSGNTMNSPLVGILDNIRIESAFRLSE